MKRELLFVFGRTHELSYQELAAVIGSRVTRVTAEIARVEDPQGKLDPKVLITTLGGTIKIARILGSIPALSAEALTPFIEERVGKVVFGVSVYGGREGVDTSFLSYMKEILESKGIAARYVAPHDGNVLSSVVITKQRVQELIVVDTGKEMLVGRTVVVQDFASWNDRDYGRPFADPKAGMLPPKAARMAVNIAGESKVKSKKSKVLLDPFCGMGTILGEALLTGWNVIGSDQSEEVVGKATKNLEWLAGLTSWKLFVSDATHVSKHLPPGSIDAIVTEPFMGSTNIKFKVKEIKDTIKGLEKLYIGCLKDWHHVLKPGGKIVIALPEYALEGKRYFVKSVIDRCENLGYTVLHGPIEYRRPQAVVRREFFVLQKIWLT